MDQQNLRLSTMPPAPTLLDRLQTVVEQTGVRAGFLCDLPSQVRRRVRGRGGTISTQMLSNPAVDVFMSTRMASRSLVDLMQQPSRTSTRILLTRKCWAGTRAE